MIAARNGDIDAAEILIEEGADVYAEYNYGYNALFSTENPQIVKMLWEAGFEFHTRDDERVTAFMKVCAYSKINIIKAILNIGVLVNDSGDEGRTALMHSIKYDSDRGIIKALFCTGADVNAKDRIGSSVNDYAELNPNPEILQILSGLDIIHSDNP